MGIRLTEWHLATYLHVQAIFRSLPFKVVSICIAIGVSTTLVYISTQKKKPSEALGADCDHAVEESSAKLYYPIEMAQEDPDKPYPDAPAGNSDPLTEKFESGGFMSEGPGPIPDSDKYLPTSKAPPGYIHLPRPEPTQEGSDNAATANQEYLPTSKSLNIRHRIPCKSSK